MIGGEHFESWLKSVSLDFEDLEKIEKKILKGRTVIIFILLKTDLRVV